MKAFQRGVGAILMFFGGFFGGVSVVSLLATLPSVVISGEENTFGILFCMLLLAALNAALFAAGLSLRRSGCRDEKYQAKMAKKAAAQRMEQELEKSRNEAKELRAALRKLNDELYNEKKLREEVEEKLWRATNPEIWADFEKVSQMFQKAGILYSVYPKASCIDSLDGVDNNTGVLWYTIHPKGDLEQAVYALIEMKRLRVSYPDNLLREHFHDYWWKYGGLHLQRYGGLQLIECFITILDLKAIRLPRTQEESQKLRELCREHNCHPVVEMKHDRYLDLLEGCAWQLDIGETWPGMADDAATYGNLEMTRLSADEGHDSTSIWDEYITSNKTAQNERPQKAETAS